MTLSSLSESSAKESIYVLLSFSGSVSTLISSLSVFLLSGFVTFDPHPHHPLYHTLSHLAYNVISHVLQVSILVTGIVYSLSKYHHSNLYQFLDGVFNIYGVSSVRY
jgi:fumarate reductase subunit D